MGGVSPFESFSHAPPVVYSVTLLGKRSGTVTAKKGQENFEKMHGQRPNHL